MRAFRVLPAPRYLGRRHPKPFGGGTRLILWHWTMASGRRRVNKDDCPQCQDGKIEVGGDSTIPECLELATYLVRAERGPHAAYEKAERFCNEVVQFLPTNVDWSIDACSIREWVDDTGRVRATWGGEERTLPPDDYTPQSLVHTPLPAADPVDPVVLEGSTLQRMAAVLDTITEDAF